MIVRPGRSLAAVSNEASFCAAPLLADAGEARILRSKYRLAAAAPADQPILPQPQILAQCRVAETSGI